MEMDKVANMVVDMKVDMVADMVSDNIKKLADMEVIPISAKFLVW